MNTSKQYYIWLLAVLIAYYEGYFSPGTLANRQNNPGNLRSWGLRPRLNGFVYFGSPEEGWRALFKQVEKNIDRNLTLYQFFAGGKGYPGYAPAADDNDPAAYARFVSDYSKIPVAGYTILQYLRSIQHQHSKTG